MCISYEFIEWNYLSKVFKKDFEKKYGKAFDITMQVIKIELKNFENLIKQNKCTMINKSSCNNYIFIKVDFKIAWQNNTKWRDEYRYIAFIDIKKCKSYLLLIYSKNNIWSWDKKCSKQNETLWWKCLIKKYYTEFLKYFSQNM